MATANHTDSEAVTVVVAEEQSRLAIRSIEWESIAVRLETPRLIVRDHEPGDLEPFCAMGIRSDLSRAAAVQLRDTLERSFAETWLLWPDRAA